jgi:16S rRNA (cytosine967-C5)-methyltransferase
MAGTSANDRKTDRARGPRTGRPEAQRAAPKPGLAARQAALGLLEVAAEGRVPPDDGLFPASPGLAPEDRARARRLALAALRHRGRSRALLRRYLTGTTPEPVLRLLDLAVVEMLAEGAPAHAVVDAAVSLALAAPRLRRQAGLMNAVLRRVAAEGPALWHGLPVTRLPAALRRALLADWGGRAVSAMEAAHEAGAPLDLTPRDPASAAALAEAMDAEVLPTGSLRIAGAGVQISALPGYETGAFWVQDAAAALPARLLNPRAGETVLDLCAAPGGKTMQLAAAGAQVTALDVSAPRLERLRANLARTGLRAEVVVADALAWEPERLFDAILLDAPCTATGTIRRHPELPLRDPLAGVVDLLALQAALIDRALGWLAPRGRLVYATCSLLKAEGEDQLAAALSRWTGRVAPGEAPLPEGVPEAWRAPGGGLRTRPDGWAERGGIDGFFMVQLVRLPD